MRLAHLILAFHQPAQLERLVKRLMTPNVDIYIQLDIKANMADFQHLGQLNNVKFVNNRVNVTWGLYSMVEATIQGYKQILASGQSYSHINLISGQDYPLKDAKTIEDFFFANPDKSFMKFKPIFEEWPESIRRITKYDLGDYQFPLRYQLQGILNKIMPDRKTPNGMKPYGFSQWMTITSDAAAYIVNFLDKNFIAKHFFKMTFCVDELIFQTILLNSPYRESIVNDHLRVIKFLKGTYRPRTLLISDAEMLVSSGKFFARKFVTEEDSAILDFLDIHAMKQ